MKTTSIISVLFAAATLLGCSEFHLSDNPNALRVRTSNMANDTFKVIAFDNAGTKVSGKIEIYNEYSRKVMERNLKEGYSRFNYPMSTSFVHVKVISDDGREGESKVWRTQTLSARN